MKLHKTDLINAVSADTGFYKAEIEEVIDSIFSLIPQILHCGDELTIKNFGKFEVKTTKEREGRNPATNEKMIIPERKVLKFKSSERVFNG